MHYESSRAVPLMLFSMASVVLLFIVTFGFGLWVKNNKAVLNTHLVFSSVCHQNPSRTLVLDSVHLPVCGRCLGIYSGLASSAFLWAYTFFIGNLAFRFKMVRFLIIGVSLFLGIEVALEMFDVILVSNEFRYVTGFVFGASVVSLLFSSKNQHYG